MCAYHTLSSFTPLTYSLHPSVIIADVARCISVTESAVLTLVLAFLSSIFIDDAVSWYPSNYQICAHILCQYCCHLIQLSVRGAHKHVVAKQTRHWNRRCEICVYLDIRVAHQNNAFADWQIYVWQSALELTQVWWRLFVMVLKCCSAPCHC